MKHDYPVIVVFCLTLLFQLFPPGTYAQTSLNGSVRDEKTYRPLEGVTVTLYPSNLTGLTNELGNFFFRSLKTSVTDIQFTSVGYGTKLISIGDFKRKAFAIGLNSQMVELSSVIVSPHAGEQNKPISKMDLAMRGLNNSQEVLCIIPGLVLGQHQGGGKAEQIFLRGFDCDHGTDFREDVDGVPINMPSHAHGQGFADSHFIISETIESVDYKKGPYSASKGDFATTGFAEFNSRNAIANNSIKLESGMFNTFRVLGMLNLLRKAPKQQQSWYLATEFKYSDSYFDNPQHFNRFNFFTKYNGKLSTHNYITLSGSAFWSKWKASGLIPERSVTEKLVGFYGALDPDEGGLTDRTHLNVQWTSLLSNGDIIKNQFFYSNYHFDLHTNFTFFLIDPVNGDEIRQREIRNLAGYNGTYNHIGNIGNAALKTEAGINLRWDGTRNTELAHTKNRYITLRDIKLGDISQLDMASYLSETLKFSEHFSINVGLRFDQFYHFYRNKLETDSLFPAKGTYRAKANTLGPKLNIYYSVNNQLQFYLSAGKGFHSNDTRVVVPKLGLQILPPAYSADFGTICKPARNILINAAVWEIYLSNEFVYGGDAGTVDFSGKTGHYGFDFSGRYEPVKALYIDADLNYSHGRALGMRKGKNYIPLAPVWSSSAGVTYAAKTGVNGSLRYRFISDRPANRDYSLTAAGYFVCDAVINYTKSNYEIGLVMNNIFNSKWKETQFGTLTRLKTEATAVNEICFTAGTPFCVRLSFTVNF